MHLHANDIRYLRERLVDFVTRNKVTFIVAKAPPMPELETSKLHIIDYISLVGQK